MPASASWSNRVPWLPPGSSELDVGLLDDLAERHALALDRGGEARGVLEARVVAARHQLLVHRRILDRLADRRGELVDRRLRRALGGQQAVPGVTADLAQALLLQRRDVGLAGPALLAEHGEALQAAGRDVRQRGRVELHLDLAGQQVVGR